MAESGKNSKNTSKNTSKDTGWSGKGFSDPFKDAIAGTGSAFDIPRKLDKLDISRKPGK